MSLPATRLAPAQRVALALSLALIAPAASVARDGDGRETGRRAPRRFFADDSFWNQPLPADPEVDPRSDEWIALLKEEPGGPFFGINTDRYTIPVYEVDETTPRHTVGHREVSPHFREVHGHRNGWFDTHDHYGHGPGFGEAVPIPEEARSDPQEDAHIAKVDWKAGTVWDAWGLVAAQRELGLRYLPLEQTLLDTCRSLVELGAARPR